MCPDNFNFKAITNFHTKLRTFKKSMHVSNFSSTTFHFAFSETHEFLLGMPL